MTTATADVKALEAKFLLQNYRRQPVVFERGQGVRLFDDAGKSYLDFLSGIGVASLGHAHPTLAKALAGQATTLVHTSNLYYHPLQGALAKRLTALTGLDRAFFCNSGTEAMEACLKFARRYWHTHGQPRTTFVALSHAFHGRTMGALSVTWDEHYRTPFEPLIPGVTFVANDDPAALAAAVGGDTAAIVLEPIQGEGGVRPLSKAMADAVAAACRTTGALLIADEVQSGSWRTGAFLHSGALGLSPDLVALGKALGAGMPIGATMLSDKVAAAIMPGDHGTTYGGNLLACRAALTFLDVMESGVLDTMRRASVRLFERLRAIAARHPDLVAEVRGAGLMAGLDLRVDALPVIQAALDRGLLVNRTSGTVVRLLPPYIVSEQDVDEGAEMLEAAVATLA